MKEIKIIDRGLFDTDHTIAVIDGRPAALVVDPDDEAVGYYRCLGPGQGVENPGDGYRWWVTEEDQWASGHISYPASDVDIQEIGNGDQGILYRDECSAEVLDALGIEHDGGDA